MRALFDQTATRLVQTFEAGDPSEPIWTWWPPEQTAGFWMRRMAHETAIHRWDAQLARGSAAPPAEIDAELACDGIDEVFDVVAPARRGPFAPFLTQQPRQGTGEVYHAHRTDGPGEWLIRFEGDGQTVTREHGKGDVAVRGTASNLLLFLWRRLPAERLEVFGDRALLDRYIELVPPD